MSPREGSDESRRRVRIAAAGVMRDASDILPVVIAHHIGQGITDFYIILHNENRSVSENIISSFGSRANLTLIHHNHPEFRQVGLSNMLRTKARRDGCNVFLPFDSDEFFVSTDKRLTLSDAIERWFFDNTTEQILVPNVNFLSPRELDDFTTGSLSLISHRVEFKPHVPYKDMKRRIEPMLKSVSRLSGMPDSENTAVFVGNHQTFRGRSRVSNKQPEPPVNFPIKCLHVPFRSRRTTENPALLTRAIEAIGRPKEEISSDEYARLFRDIWSVTSMSPGEHSTPFVDRGDYYLVADDSLGQVLSGISAAGFDIDDPWCASIDAVAHEDAVFSSQIIENEFYFDVAITALHALVLRVKEETAAFELMRREKRETVARLRKRVDFLQGKNAQLRRRIDNLEARLQQTQPDGFRGLRALRAFRAVARHGKLVLKRLARGVN